MRVREERSSCSADKSSISGWSSRSSPRSTSPSAVVAVTIFVTQATLKPVSLVIRPVASVRNTAGEGGVGGG